MTQTEQIERDIERTRHDMDETIEEMEQRIKPGHLIDEAMNWFRSSDGASETVRSVGKSVATQIKEHPIPSLLIGAGLAWLACESSDEEKAQDGQTGHWRNLPEYSGSYVDAATGQPYPGRYPISAAWDEEYDWTGEEESSWQYRARQSMDHLKHLLSDSQKSAREKIRETASHMRNLRGDKYEKARGHWRDLPEYSGSFVDARTGEPYNENYGYPFHPAEDLEYLSSHDWSEQEEQTWSDKAQKAVDKMRESASHSGHSVQRRVKTLASQLSEFAGMMQGRTSQAGGKLRSGAKRAGQTAGHYAHQIQEQSGRLARGAQQRSSQAIDEYPLAVGAACLGLGLVVGLVLPPSRQEDRWFGEASDEVKDRAHEVYERGKEVARETGHAAMEEAERQGLTPSEIGQRIKEGASHVADTARQEAGGTSDLGEKAERVADKATETAKTRSKQELESVSS